MRHRAWPSSVGSAVPAERDSGSASGGAGVGRPSERSAARDGRGRGSPALGKAARDGGVVDGRVLDHEALDGAGVDGGSVVGTIVDGGGVDGGGVDARRSRRVRVGVGAAIVLAIVAAVIAVLVSATAQQGRSVELGSAFGPSSAATDVPTSATTEGATRLLLHVTGAVREPGLVELPAGSRVVDAVAAAGGAAEAADIAAVNLARPVADGEQLVVPRVGDPPVATGTVAGGASAGSGAGVSGTAGAPVNLNTATAAELETLPRIGPTLAQRIVDWRAANGRFGTTSDLMKVSGIGQKLFDGLKDRVAV